jgi:hypothetical protein
VYCVRVRVTIIRTASARWYFFPSVFLGGAVANSVEEQDIVTRDCYPYIGTCLRAELFVRGIKHVQEFWTSRAAVLFFFLLGCRIPVYNSEV